MSDPRYPIGEFEVPPAFTASGRQLMIEEIAKLPAELNYALAALPPGGLDKPYREGGWTARQVVHHLADSHMNSWVRFKLALTEDSPVIKPYDEAAWARLADSNAAPVEPSLVILDGLHARWVGLMRGMNEEEWQRKFVHPELGVRNLEKTLALYAWHGKHHVAQIRLLSRG